MRLLDAETGYTLAVMENEGERVGSVAFSPDGLTLGFEGPGRTVMLWDLRDIPVTGNHIIRIDKPLAVLERGRGRFMESRWNSIVAC